MSKKKDLEQTTLFEHSLVKAAYNTVYQAHAALMRLVDNALASTARQVEQQYSSASQRANSEFEQARSIARSSVQTAIGKAGPLTAPWSDSAWRTYKPPQKGSPPETLRLGELRLNGSLSSSGLPTMPALLPLLGHHHLVISADDTQSRQAAGILESLAWRIAALSPPGTYRFVLLDPLDSGTNLASLLKLPEEIRGPKIYWQEPEVEEALKAVAGQMEEVLQRRLLNTYRDIEAYNAANPDVAVPYYFLIGVGFPKRFTARALDLLSSIMRSGQRAGCYLLTTMLRNEKPPYGFDITALLKMATQITIKDSRQVEWNDPDFPNVSIQPDSPPPLEIVDSLSQAIKPLAAASSSTAIPFQRIAVRKANWWQTSSGGGLGADIGIDESGKVFRIGIGKGGGSAQHMLVGGTTNMGKTNLLHLLVLMFSTAYSPDDLALYLVDFKGGVEFQDYVTHSLPHARAVVLEAEREFGLSILQRLVEEMEKRSQLFKAAGVSDIEEYRNRVKDPLPRVLLIIDEYVVLFAEDDRLAFQASDALAALVMRGRAFGIHILLSAQRPASTFLSMTHIKSQMGLRIALKCRPDDSTLILGEGNEKAARLTQAGEAYVTSDPDRIDASVQVRTARVSPDDRNLYLRGLTEFARLQHYTRSSPMIVFSRDAPALWAKNRQVVERMASSDWLPLPAPTFWLGQPLRIAEDLAVPLEPQQGSHLLVMGSDEGSSARILLNSILGLGLTSSPENTRFVVIGNIDPQQPAGQTLEAIRAGIPHTLQIHARQEAVDALAALAAEMNTRLTKLPARSSETVFLVVAGLHRWLEARGPNAYTPSAAGEQLARICQQGPLVGIHVLMWCDRTTTMSAVVGTAAWHDTLAQFGHRVALHMSADESLNFIGSPQASKLSSERAYYRSEQWTSDVLDKFKPYTLVPASEVASIVATMKAKWAHS
jgi:DNA segregation ATPase FtsK/SpoIIIE, S-DNA-T family